MVAREHRGHDLFELLMVQGLLYACDAGFLLVFGGMRPERRFRPFVEELGFKDFGSHQSVTIEVTELVQPLVAETRGNRERWLARKLAVLARFREKGYEIIDRGCSLESAGEGAA